MREAKNRKAVIDTVEREANFKIEILSGEEEANLIFSNYFSQNLNIKQDYLFIDVGGGSTELTLIKKGKRVKGQSFDVGTVRSLAGSNDKAAWKSIEKWLSMHGTKLDSLIAIGTGGNVNTLFKLQGKKPMEMLSNSEIKILYKQLNSVSLDERIFTFKLRPDRADVIIPACEIYLRIMEIGGIKQMIVPKIGLSDGMILHMAGQLKMD
jgi:exopolyphosphatase/guanosine-5'-triphosphate,3'-diphosphate pyrophosphatase